MDGNTTGRLVHALPDHRNLNRNDETARMSQATDELLPNHLSPQHLDTIQAERLRVFEGLLRTHIKFVKYPTTHPPARGEVGLGAQRSLLVRRLAARLEKREDVIAAILIRAALNVAENATDDDDTAMMNEFLQLAVGSLLEDQQKGAEIIYKVLGDLVRREGEGDDSLDSADQPDTSDGESTSPGFGLTVLVGNERIPLPFHKILPFFWSPSALLATDCHTCALPFVAGDPPIRTINIAMSDARILGVRVFNRHFTCIKDSSIPFVPVSHVWTDSIREANANRAHNDTAATKLISTLAGLGAGAKHAYGTEVEFWHDYFSVPQWQPEIKEQLLIRLPAIYHLADEILVHLEDLYPSSMPFLVVPTVLKMAGNDPCLKVMQAIPHIRALLGSEWMARMWVMLEYAQCRAACVMTKGGHIYRVRDHDTQNRCMEGIYARDSFSHALTIAHSYLPNLLRYARSIAVVVCHSAQFLGGLAVKPLITRGSPPRLFLGEAIELVASRQCQYSRDKLIACDALLDDRRTAWKPAGSAVLPDSEAEACAHVWLKALRQGDCTPLLLQPRESTPGSNPSTQPGLASWVVGHSGLEGVKWGYGVQTTAPDHIPTITDESVIRVHLALAGEIEQICYLDVEISGEVAGVAFGVHHISEVAKAEGAEVSPQLLVDSLNRVFPLEDMYQERARQNGWLFSFADLDGQDAEFSDRIRGLLKEYEDAGDVSRLAQVAQSISDALGLEAKFIEDGYANITRLRHSMYMADQREKRGAKGGDPICKVRCPGCRRVALFRLDLRETGGVGQQVYRIPGLTYANSNKDGVGLVIDKEGRITGRMFFGTPACDCRLMVDVEVH